MNPRLISNIFPFPLKQPQTAPLLQQVLQNANTGEKNIVIVQQSPAQSQKQQQNAPNQTVILQTQQNKHQQVVNNQVVQVTPNAAAQATPGATVTVSAGSPAASSMIIKSLLASKVTTSNVDVNVNASATVNSAALIAPNVNVHQVTFLTINQIDYFLNFV